MKSPRGLAASKSSEAFNEAQSYSSIASEYYDERLHPTCADFREASKIFLNRLFSKSPPSGRIADIGCGRSLVAEFATSELVLIDESREMLAQNAGSLEKRRINVETSSFGEREFDWIFAVLADPFNSLSTWKNIARAMKKDGKCIFIVPSYVWTRKYRKNSIDERENLARFVTSTGNAIFLRSLIVSPVEQERMIVGAGLRIASVDHILVGELPKVRSPKVSEALAETDPILDIFQVCNN